jgi:queuosine precursor transporter
LITPSPMGWMSVAVYVLAIVLLNWMFLPQNLIEGFTQWTTSSWFGTFYLANVIVGFVYVLRDYAQRAIGHSVLAVTAIAGGLTYLMVDPALAIASITAFFVSEMADWAIYSFWKQPLQNRILVSSLIAAPLDTGIFQSMAGYYSPAAFTTELLSKFLGVLAVWYLLKMRSGPDSSVLPA